MDAQTAELLEELKPMIEQTRRELGLGASPSDVANWLHRERLGNLKILFLFVKATGVSLGDAKAMGCWWGPEGVTDRVAFDTEAHRLLRDAKARQA